MSTPEPPPLAPLVAPTLKPFAAVSPGRIACRAPLCAGSSLPCMILGTIIAFFIGKEMVSPFLLLHFGFLSEKAFWVLLIAPGLLVFFLVAALPALFLTRSLRGYLMTAGGAFLGSFASLLTFPLPVPDQEITKAFLFVACGPAVGAGLGLALGITRRTLSGIIGGFFFGSLGGIVSWAAGAALIRSLPQDTNRVLPAILTCLAFGPLLWLITVLGLALSEYLAERLGSNQQATSTASPMPDSAPAAPAEPIPKEARP